MAMGAAMKGAFKGLGKLGRLSQRAEKGAAAPLYRRGRASPLSRTGPVTFQQLRDVLAQAGQKPGRFNFRYVPARDAPDGGHALGWVGRDGGGNIVLDDLGRPIIYFTDMGLSSLREAVITFGHELKHIEDIMIKKARVSPEAHAEKAGRELWAKVISVLKRPRK